MILFIVIFCGIFIVGLTIATIILIDRVDYLYINKVRSLMENIDFLSVQLNACENKIRYATDEIERLKKK